MHRWRKEKEEGEKEAFLFGERDKNVISNSYRPSSIAELVLNSTLHTLPLALHR